MKGKKEKKMQSDAACFSALRAAGSWYELGKEKDERRNKEKMDKDIIPFRFLAHATRLGEALGCAQFRSATPARSPPHASERVYIDHVDVDICSRTRDGTRNCPAE